MTDKTLSKSVHRTRVAILFATLLLVACSDDSGLTEHAAATVEAPSVSTNEVEDPSGADQAWELLTSSPPQESRRQGDSFFEHFMRQAELSNQRRRKLGSKFWSDYPGDSRRYDWLLLTIHMAPHYPQNLDEWVEAQSQIGPNTAPVDLEALSSWEASYEVMRAEFFTSQDVNEQHRRSLSYGELRESFRRLQVDVDMGKQVSAQKDLDAIVNHLKSYPEPTSELDADSHWYSTAPLIELVLRNSTSLSLSQAEQEHFKARVSQISETTSEMYNWLITWLEEIHALPESDGNYSLDASLRTWRLLPWRFAVGAASTLEERVVFYYNRAMRFHRFREIGSRLWNEVPSHEGRVFWLSRSLQGPSIYYDGLVDGLWTSARQEYLNIRVDEQAESSWGNQYAAYFEELWAAPNTTSEQRGEMLAKRVAHNLYWKSRADWKKRGDKSSVVSALDDIHALWLEYRMEDEPRKFTVEVIRNPPEWGLSDEEIAEFLAPMLHYEHPVMRSVAEGWFRNRELRNTPLDFSAPTLAGEPFDISSLRGKIVLIDYWTTSCAVCISAMPLIHDIYEQYRDRGFEVVSVNFDADRNRKKVERIEHELGLTWITLNAEEQWAEANARFGWGNILPVYMLLNHEGKLVAGTAEIDYGKNLRALLDELLKAEAIEKEAATVH